MVSGQGLGSPVPLGLLDLLCFGMQVFFMAGQQVTAGVLEKAKMIKEA